jgi:hypothetical protein
MHSGHYYCYVKSAMGIWHEMDDEGVSPVSEKTALGQRAYLLFYTKVGTRLEESEGGRNREGAGKAKKAGKGGKAVEGATSADAAGTMDERVAAVAVAKAAKAAAKQANAMVAANGMASGEIKAAVAAAAAAEAGASDECEPKSKKKKHGEDEAKAVGTKQAAAPAEQEEEPVVKKRRIVPQQMEEREAMMAGTVEQQEAPNPKAATEHQASKGVKGEEEKAARSGQKIGGGGGGMGEDARSNGDVDALSTSPPKARVRTGPGAETGAPAGEMNASASALKSPHRHGNLLSARDSGRLSLMLRRLKHQIQGGVGVAQTSPVKTRAARRRTSLPRSPRLRTKERGAATGVGVAESGARAGKSGAGVAVDDPAVAAAAVGLSEGGSAVPNIGGGDGGGRGVDGKAVKQWLNRSARAANVVGRGSAGGGGGGGGGGWDDTPEDADAPKPVAAKGAGRAKTGGRGDGSRRDDTTGNDARVGLGRHPVISTQPA